jgi:hypothetical protein
VIAVHAGVVGHLGGGPASMSGALRATRAGLADPADPASQAAPASGADRAGLVTSLVLVTVVSASILLAGVAPVVPYLSVMMAQRLGQAVLVVLVFRQRRSAERAHRAGEHEAGP